MSVNKQFWVLIAAIVLTPMLFMLLFITLQFGLSVPLNYLPATANIQVRQAVMVESWLEQRHEAEPFNPVPWLDLVIWEGPDQELLYVSDLAEVEQWEAVTPERIRRNFDVTFSHYQVEGQQYQVGFVTPQGHWQPGGFALPPELLVIVTLASVAALISIWIILTLKRRLRTLGEATKRITEGDLDTELPVGDDDLGRLADSFNNMRENLKEAREGRDRLIMSVSHDLKTPLASIKGYTDAMRDGLAKTPEQRRKYLGIIATKTELLEARIHDLIDFVKLSGSQWPMNVEALPIKPVVDEWFADFRRELALYDREVRVDNRLPDEEQLALDERLLERALENLVSNARLYSPPAEPVWLVARIDAQYCLIEVGSLGEAIPEQARSQLFEPFYRIDPGRNKRGLGLGLTVVRTIAEQQGGRVGYRHERGINWFSIELPRG